MSSELRPRRLFVSGGSALSSSGATFCRALGRCLAHKDGLVVITGGHQRRLSDDQALTTDRMTVEGMLSVLGELGVPADQRIETILPDVQHDWNKSVRFREGRIRFLQNRNAQSRRFTMVQSADVVTSVEGGDGTRSVLDVALALERPLLPLPFGGGVSETAWRDQRHEIISWFQLSDDEVRMIERTRLACMSEADICALAELACEWLMRGFTQGCFVIMGFNAERDPVFDHAIQPALEVHGFRAWRTDRTVPTGDVVAAIRDGISHCYFAIADTTEDRPNVMYELGLAHASNKPVILLRRSSNDGTLPKVPFDFQTQSILKYTDDNLEGLRSRLEVAIGMMSGKQRDHLVR